MNTDKYVGLDVHKDTTVAAIAEGGREGECRIYGTLSSDLHALEKLLRKLGGEGVRLHVVYEAGPTGFVIARQLEGLGIACTVAAPAQLPRHQLRTVALVLACERFSQDTIAAWRTRR